MVNEPPQRHAHEVRIPRQPTGTPPASTRRNGASQPSPPALAAALASLVPGLGAVAVVVAIAVRVLAAAAYDPATALALVGSAGELTVIVGALLATLPYLALALVLAAASVAPRPRPDSPPPATSRSLLLLGGLLAAILLLFIAPWYFVVLAAVLGPVLSLLSGGTGRHIRPSDEDLEGSWHAYQYRVLEQVRRGTRRAATVGIAVVAALFLTRLDVWAPTERLQYVDGHQQVAYVMSVDGRWTTLLTSPDRQVLRVQSDSIAERRVCRPRSDTDARTMWEVVTGILPGSFNVTGPPKYPSCDTPL